MIEKLNQLYLGKEIIYDISCESKEVFLHALEILKERGFTYELRWNNLEFSPQYRRRDTPYFQGHILSEKRSIRVMGIFRVSLFHLFIISMVTLTLIVSLLIGIAIERFDASKLFFILLICFIGKLVYDRYQILNRIKDMKVQLRDILGNVSPN